MRGFLVILLYLLAAAAALHAVRRDSARPVLQEPALYLAFAALLAHAAWLVDVLSPFGAVTLSLAESASLMGLAIGAAGLLALFAPRFRGVAAIVFVIAALLAAGTGSLPEPREIATPGWPLAVHVVLAMASAGLFAVAAVFVVLLALQDQQLRSRRPSRLARDAAAGREPGTRAVLGPVDRHGRAVGRDPGGTAVRHRSFRPASRPQDRARARRLGHLRGAAVRTLALRLARTQGRALHDRRVRRARDRVLRQQVRARSRAGAALGLTP